MPGKKLLILCSVLYLLAMVAGRAGAASYPDKPITYIIAFNPGGESDIFAQAQLPLLEKILGQNIRLSYRAGNGGAVGWNELIRSAPDGYTVAGYNLPHIILQPLQRKSSGYATQNFKPVMLFMSTPNILVVPANSPFNTLQDVIDAARARPGNLVLGGSGKSSANHLAVLLLNKLIGVNVSYRPFTGTADAMPALLGNQVSGLMTYTPMAFQYKHDMKVLAVATEKRVPGIDAPTFKELGINLVEGAYRGVCVPQKTPDTIVSVLYTAFDKVNSNPAFVEKMTTMGFTMESYDPAQTEALIKEKLEVYATLLSELEK